MQNKRKLNIMFLCTGNACRSQIAESWAMHLKSNTIEAFSAGIKPIGVSERAIRVMAEVGVDISKNTSNHIDDFDGIDFDYIITLCDSARQNCPVFPCNVKVVHHPFEDPYFAAGSDEQVMSVFRKVRDQIKEYIMTLPESLENEKK